MTELRRTGWLQDACEVTDGQRLDSVTTLQTTDRGQNRQIRAVPEIILGGGTFFFRPLHPQDTHGVRAPRPPGHVSALINLPHYGSNTPWPPGQVTSPPPTPRTHCQQNTLHPQDKKVFAAPPPEDNFWNSPYTHSALCSIVDCRLAHHMGDEWIHLPKFVANLWWNTVTVVQIEGKNVAFTAWNCTGGSRDGIEHPNGQHSL